MQGGIKDSAIQLCGCMQRAGLATHMENRETRTQGLESSRDIAEDQPVLNHFLRLCNNTRARLLQKTKGHVRNDIAALKK